ncbi:MAG TPA: M1 family aminopeptidase, partial [Kofleriaceae bacterium]|nr:M1 family aminopeptidase [Kofleriaceae bacterium]
AHQWFGDLVTTAWWDDIWLNEGFASWLAAKITVAFEPAWRFDLLAEPVRDFALSQDSLVSARRVRQGITGVGDIFQAFDGITYNKGAAILAMFERAIGPDKFRDGVRAYMSKHRFGNAVSADFTAAISAVARRDVAPAFSSFLDQVGAPVVRSELRCEAGKPPTLALHQERYHRPGSPTAEAAPWRIPVCVAFERRPARAAQGGGRGELCSELTAARAELVLPVEACPSWVFTNAGSSGYYRTSQSEAGLIALRDRGWAQLTPVERLTVFNDIAAFAVTGELDIGLELSFAAKLLAEHHRFANRVAVNAAQDARGWLPAAQQPRFDAWSRKTFGPAARALSWQAGPHDDVDAERSRAALVTLVAWSGDAALRTAAVKLAKNWRAIDPAIRVVALAVAADADAATFDRLRADALAEADLELRSDLLRALSLVGDEARLRSVVALAFDPKIDIATARGLLFSGRDLTQARVVDAYLRERLRDVLARFPDNGTGNAGFLSNVFLRSCDASRRDADAAFVREHLGALPGAERLIARGLESLDQCIATRALLGPRLEAWLARSAR